MQLNVVFYTLKERKKGFGLLGFVNHLSSREIASLPDLSLSGWRIAIGYIWSTQSLICPLSQQPIRGQTEVTSWLTQSFSFNMKGLGGVSSDKT